MDTTVNHQSPQSDADDEVSVHRPPRKSKRRLLQLLNLRPSICFRTASVIGPPSCPTYVVEVDLDGQVSINRTIL